MDFFKKIIIKIFGEKFYFSLRWFLKYGPRYFSLLDYWFIPGWLSEKEALALYKVILNLDSLSPTVLEIGSWLGKSSVVLAKACKVKKGILYCIDPFDASGDNFSKESYSKEKNLKEQFIYNIKKAKVDKYIKVIVGKSQDVARNWDKQIDFLFIDANHSYQSVKEDFLAWSKFLKKGGYISFHDACYFDIKTKVLDGGPAKVIEENILNNPNWQKILFVDSLFVAKKLQ